MHPDQRVYNMILTSRIFGNSTHTYALLGHENGKGWNLLGGKANHNETYEQAASRELFEESGKYYDIKSYKYWQNLKYYEHPKHRVYIHPPQSLVGSICNIQKLNDATKMCMNDPTLPHDYKEMHRYQLVKLSDLINLANSQHKKGEDTFCNHPSEKDPMRIDGWMLFTLARANISELLKYA